MVEWEQGEGGWRPPATRLDLLDSMGRKVTAEKGRTEAVAALEAEERFNMVFTPVGEGIEAGRGVRTEAELVKREK